jgi:hypothetical protein
MEKDFLLEEELKRELKRELEKTINIWVDKTFNFIRVSVLEKYCDNSLVDYIRTQSVNEAFDSWFNDCNAELKIKEWLTETDEYWETNNEEFNVELKISEFLNYDGSIKESFQFAFGDKWDEFVEWCCEQYEDDILEYIYGKENYPIWNTCFEFRDSFYNSEEDVQKCISVGLGVIEGLDDFNNLLFMTSAGHSFYSAYWIPLYFKFFPSEAEKFTGIDYSDL